jgi:hypothetical protein
MDAITDYDPRREHARLPANHRLLRGPWLGSSIPRPTEEDREHDAQMDRLAAAIARHARAEQRQSHRQPRASS